MFAAAVAQVASPLRRSLAGRARPVRPALHHDLVGVDGTRRLLDRFDTDDGVQRGLTLLQMFGVAVMAANARDALDSRSSAGFAAAYSVLRFVLGVSVFSRAPGGGRPPACDPVPGGTRTGGRVVAHVRSGSDPCAVRAGPSRSRSTSARPGWRFVRASLCLLTPRTSPNDSVCSL